MSNFRQGSAPKDTHRRLGKQDEEFRERHSLQVPLSSDNHQDGDFSEGHSPLTHMSSENKIQQQQQPQLINGVQQGYPLKDSDSKESSEISTHSQQQTLVTSPQGYPPKDDSPLNHQSSYPKLQQQQSSTKISTSQEHSSKGGNPTNTQNTHHSPQQQLLAGATSMQEQLPREESSYNIRHLQPPGRVHSSPKDIYSQPCNQSSYPSKQQPSPISVPSPPKNNHIQESNQSSHQSHQQPSPIMAPSERHLLKDDYTASSPNSKHLQQQQPSDCLQGEPPKPVHPLKPSIIPTRELSNTSCTQQDSTNNYDPYKSQSTLSKDPSAQGNAAPLRSVQHESVNQKIVTKQKDETSTKKVPPSKVESSPKNVGVPRTPSKPSSKCPCSIL